jgi:uncharacterized protein (TIGR02145 family)
MILKKAFFVAVACLAIHPVSAITISGIVKNSSGNGIEGVRVKLGKADMTTTTGSDGSFTITDVTGVDRRSGSAGYGNIGSIQFEHNSLLVTTTKPSAVTLRVYDCTGKCLLSYAKGNFGNTYQISFPQFGSGVHLYQVAVNNELHTFKRVTSMAGNLFLLSSLPTETSLARQAQISKRIDDALMFIKQGYQYYRCAIKNSDTSGVQVTLSPLDTGTVADVEGNVYRTVRIGNQYWTTENLRTTKYTNGTSIGNACYFYKNTTDAAARKKWGALYTDAAANSGKLAPTGWRVPKGADWDTLLNYLISNGYNFDGTTKKDFTAKALASSTEWPTSIDSGAVGNDLTLNNASGFSATPAGWKFYEFEKQGTGTYFWIAGGGAANVCSIWWILSTPDRHSTINFGASIRLVKHI